MKLIVGLGNPGKKYDNTRHNIGFDIIDNYLKKTEYKIKFNALYEKRNILGNDVIFIKPLTYMNLSGDAVVKFVNYYDIAIDDILVVQDDLDMDIGTYKLKKNSSSGGHNGIKSIISCLNNQNFLRLKIGINDAKKGDVIDFVLGKFTKNNKELITKIDTENIINMFIKEGFEQTINKYKG